VRVRVCARRQLKGCVGSRDRELASLRRQLDAAQAEAVGHGRAREVAVRENRRLQDDLATMTRENQVEPGVCVCVCVCVCVQRCHNLTRLLGRPPFESVWKRAKKQPGR